MTTLPRLNLPHVALRLREPERDGGRASILCLCRRRYVALTPEEWVRQNFIGYMVFSLGYPQALVAAEMPVDVNGQRQRADIVAFSRTQRPLVIVECKAPSVALSQATLNQACRYLSSIGAVAVVLTNGLRHYCVGLGVGGGAAFLSHVPSWAEVSEMARGGGQGE